jgi:hypothetical protein
MKKNLPDWQYKPKDPWLVNRYKILKEYKEKYKEKI